jgi:hypothetical protein
MRRSFERRSPVPPSSVRSDILRLPSSRIHSEIFTWSLLLSKPLPPCLEPRADDPRWGPPLDVCDVAVRLEAAGVTDAVARREYLQQTTWQLAEACLPWSRMFVASDPPERKPSAILEYLRGISFSFSLLVCCLAMAYFHFSLWGGDVSAKLAAAVGLGTVSSFLMTGGIVQAMA